MSLDANDPLEFVRWRDQHRATWAPRFDDVAAAEGDYPPRRLFGMYASDVLAESIAEARRQGVEVDVLADEVVRITPASHGHWRAFLGSGKAETFDIVVLALGHAPLPRFDPDVRGARYYANPWSASMSVASSSPLGILGSRLTAIDVALQLSAAGHTGPIFIVSRSGALPSVKGPLHDHTLQAIPRYVRDHAGRGQVSLREVAALVRSELDLSKMPYTDWQEATTLERTTAALLRTDIELAESGRHAHWQSVLDAIVPWIPDLWRLLDAPGQTELSTVYRTAWLVRVASFPSITGRRLLPIMESGQLRVRSSFQYASDTERGFRLHYSDSSPPLDVDYLLNATGPGYGRNVVLGMPLTRALVEEGIAEVHPDGGLRVAPDTFEVLRPNGTRHVGLHLMGDLSRSVWGATNTVAGTVRQATIVARQVALRAEALAGPVASSDAPAG